jgi:RAT1-interacting protein
MAEQTLPQKSPLHSKSPSPASEREDGPPRKRPRTRAPPQTAASSKVTDTETTSATIAPQLPTTMPQSQTHSFPIQPLNRFQGASARIKRPQEVAHFSFDDNHKYVYDDSGINYYVPPPIGADLKEGFNTFKHHEDKEDAHLDALLKALVDKEKKDGDVARAKADFVTWRGMMTKVR